MHTDDIKNLSQYYSVNFPKVSLLISQSIGDIEGAIEFISSRLSLNTERITNYIDKDYLLTLYTRSLGSIYIINIDELTINKQNTILKFIEEPPINSYIVLLASMMDIVLETVQTRSVIIELHKYNKDEIRTYISKLSNIKDADLLLAVSDTIDDVNNYCQFNLEDLYLLCNKIVKSLHTATLANTLTIPNKYILNGNFELILFIKMLKYCILENYAMTMDKHLYNMYLEIVGFCKKLRYKSISSEILLNNLFGRIWLIARG